MGPAAKTLGISITTLCGRIIQQQNWLTNRLTGQVGKSIYLGEYEEGGKRETVGEEEAEYLKNVELKGLGKRPYTDLKLRLDKYGVKLPSHNKLFAYEKEVCYPTVPFEGGLRSPLSQVVKVKSDS
jgi:hypothetical protein